MTPLCPQTGLRQLQPQTSGRSWTSRSVYMYQAYLPAICSALLTWSVVQNHTGDLEELYQLVKGHECAR